MKISKRNRGNQTKEHEIGEVDRVATLVARVTGVTEVFSLHFMLRDDGPEIVNNEPKITIRMSREEAERLRKTLDGMLKSEL